MPTEHENDCRYHDSVIPSEDECSCGASLRAAEREMIAREIVKYALEHDVLTQHGMKGIREKIQKAMSGAEALHKLALKRIESLMDAKSGTPEGEEFSALVDAVQAYERQSGRT